MESPVNGQQRGSIRIGLVVDIIQKEDQRSGKKTRGIVQEILTNSLSHPHGIKVQTERRPGREGNRDYKCVISRRK